MNIDAMGTYPKTLEAVKSVVRLFGNVKKISLTGFESSKGPYYKLLIGYIFEGGINSFGRKGIPEEIAKETIDYFKSQLEGTPYEGKITLTKTGTWTMSGYQITIGARIYVKDFDGEASDSLQEKINWEDIKNNV